MRVDINANPPKGRGKRHGYADLIEAITNNNGWVAVFNEDVAGSTKAQRQTALQAACQRAGIRIETRTDASRVFVRALKPTGVQDAQ